MKNRITIKENMNTSQNRFDSLEQLISEEGLSIKAVDVHRDLDLMLIILNTKVICTKKSLLIPD